MTLAFRAGSFVSAGNATGNALVVNKPTGTADGDLVVFVCYLESDTNTWTAPAGFASLFRQANAGAFSIQVFVKLASGEGASYTFTPATLGTWRTIVGGAYSAGTGTGTILDIANGAQADAVVTASQTAPSITTTVANDMVVFGYGNFAGDNPASLAGFATNLRGAFGGIVLGDAVKAAAGATGTTNPVALGSETYVGIHAAMISDTGGGGGGGGAAPPNRRRLLGVG